MDTNNFVRLSPTITLLSLFPRLHYYRLESQRLLSSLTTRQSNTNNPTFPSTTKNKPPDTLHAHNLRSLSEPPSLTTREPLRSHCLTTHYRESIPCSMSKSYRSQHRLARSFNSISISLQTETTYDRYKSRCIV